MPLVLKKPADMAARVAFYEQHPSQPRPPNMARLLQDIHLENNDIDSDGGKDLGEEKYTEDLGEKPDME